MSFENSGTTATSSLPAPSYARQAGGMSYGDYPSARLRTGPSAKIRAGVEQLTYLLLLKMADERTMPPFMMRLYDA